MDHQPYGQHQPPGETSPSPQRPAQHLRLPLLTFDLMAELAQLQQEESWRRGDRNAKTLVKESGLRVTMTALKAGAKLDQHETDGPLTIHALRGKLRLAVGGQPVELTPGHLLALDALEDSAFLLTIGWLHAG
jgi:hypothetical protein